MKFFRIASVLLLLLLIGSALSFPDFFGPSHRQPVAQSDQPDPAGREQVIEASSSSPSPPSLHAGYACVMDADSKRILYAKEGDSRVPIASTTKIMTLIVALESQRGEELVTVSERAASMPKVHLGARAGYQFKLKDLFYSLMLESHNDSAVAIAEHIGGSVEGFAQKMNEKASQLGLTNTHVVTPNGLDADEHYSTASDLCRLAAYAIQNPDFCEIIQTKSYRFSTADKKHTYSLTNRDAFLSYYPGALGIKTGFTGKAGYCFVGAAKKDDTTLISCVLACGWPPDKSWKWSDTKNLMNYGFDNFSVFTFPVDDLSTATIRVKDGKKDRVLCVQPSAPQTLCGPFDKVKITYDLPKILYAPVRKDHPVGTVSYYINDELFSTEKVFLTENIEKSSFSDTIRNVLTIWMECFGTNQSTSDF